jgi:hypothetical protein
LKALFVLAAVAIGLLAGCDGDARRSKLAGTWQRNLAFDSGNGRATIVLDREGKFTERVEICDSGTDEAKTIPYAGLWLTDGDTFTLRYLEEDGRHYSGRYVRFTTLFLTSVTHERLIGRDELGSRTVTYERVEGAQPGTSLICAPQRRS